MGREKIFSIVKVLSLVGLFLASYLLFEQITKPANPFCSINSRINCDPIISGVLSKTLGIPTPLYGLIGYLVIFCASISKHKNLLLGMASFGLAFCLWIGYREVLVLGVICPVCLACQGVMLAIFILALILRKN